MTIVDVGGLYRIGYRMPYCVLLSPCAADFVYRRFFGKKFHESWFTRPRWLVFSIPADRERLKVGVVNAPHVSCAIRYIMYFICLSAVGWISLQLAAVLFSLKPIINTPIIVLLWDQVDSSSPLNTQPAHVVFKSVNADIFTSSAHRQLTGLESSRFALLLSCVITILQL